MGIPEGTNPAVPWDPQNWPINAEGLIEVPEECIPNPDDLFLADGELAKSFFNEKQQRLLTEPLYSSWAGPGDNRPFLVTANVGLFTVARQPALAPDVMLSLDVRVPDDLFAKSNRSYLYWEIGKLPEVVIEFVSDLTGGEDSYKRLRYAEAGITYYVILDPQDRLGDGVLRAFVLSGGEYTSLSPGYLPRACLGLTLWQGEYEEHHDTWLRWCNREGVVIPTGRERAEQERERADTAEQRAETAEQRADTAEQRAQTDRERANRLAARLRELGIDPDT